MAIYEPAYGGIQDAVRMAIPRCPDRYSIEDVQRALAAMGNDLPRASVSQAMHRLMRKKEIRVAERGTSCKPTIYKKSGPQE